MSEGIRGSYDDALYKWTYTTVYLLYNETILYNTIYFRALKSWRDGQLNLAHGTETEQK